MKPRSDTSAARYWDNARVALAQHENAVGEMARYAAGQAMPVYDVFCELARKAVAQGARQLIDIGCGAGQYARLWRECGGGEYLGVDTWDATRLARAAPWAADGRYMHGDLDAIAGHQDYDTVLCACSLEYAPHPPSALWQVLTARHVRRVIVHRVRFVDTGPGRIVTEQSYCMAVPMYRWSREELAHMLSWFRVDARAWCRQWSALITESQ